MTNQHDVSATNTNIIITEGDDETFAITREQDDGTAIDISNYTFWLTIKSARDDADVDAVVQKTVTSHTDPTNGKTEIDLTNSDTDNLQGVYFYDMQYKTGSGSIKTFLTGKMEIRPDVTEATS